MSTAVAPKYDESPSAQANKRPPVKRHPSMSDLLNWEKPWVLVEDGSMGGYFNWVPLHLRVGPWHPAAVCHLAVMLYILAIGAIWFHSSPPETGWISKFLEVEAYEAYTISWFYNLAGFLWTLIISLDVYFNGAIGGGAWATYTLQSWTYIMLRHGLCALAPFFPSLVLYAEVLRLPVLITASCTFAIWNFALAPAILLFFVKDPEQRQRMLKYFTNFRLTQLHVANIVFAVANAALAYPTRELHGCDLYVVGWQATLYMIWYYGVLDRLGVHLYPIFSPRSPLLLLSSSIVAFAYVYGYWFWKKFLEREER